MKVPSLFLVVVLLSGCGTFSIKQIEKSDAALDFAKKSLAKVDYSKLNEKLKLPKSAVKTVGPVQQYSALASFWTTEPNEWYFYQRVRRTDGIECYSYLHVVSASSGRFSIATDTPGKFHCFEDETKYQTVDLF